MCALTLALPGTQHWPRSGNLMLRVRDEKLVKPRVHDKIFPVEGNDPESSS